MDSPDIMSHGCRLNAIIYLAAGAESHGTVLLLHGFPGNEQNLDLAYSIRRAGWNVLFPHYRGSWGSAGTFSFSNAIEDTQAALDFLRDPANAKKYRIDTKKIVLVGHSMGGFMVRLHRSPQCGRRRHHHDLAVEHRTFRGANVRSAEELISDRFASPDRINS